MARNAEKAMSMLNRYVQAKRDEFKKEPDKRPYSASLVTTIPECEKWRRQIIKEIGTMVTNIQNVSLGEHRIRDLNDQINKTIRLKRHWEYRIAELGGPDYGKGSARLLDDNGKEIIGFGAGSYKYFGAAKDLPGVRELFQTEAVGDQRRTRYEMYKSIDADYYGYRDDDDGILRKVEAEAEQRARQVAVAEYSEIQKFKSQNKAAATASNTSMRPSTDIVQALMEQRERDADIGDGNNNNNNNNTNGEDTDMQLATSTALMTEEERRGLVAHVVVPTAMDVHRILIEKRKKAILAKYVQPQIKAS